MNKMTVLAVICAVMGSAVVSGFANAAQADNAINADTQAMLVVAATDEDGADEDAGKPTGDAKTGTDESEDEKSAE